MFEFLISVISIFLFIKAVKLAFKITWGIAKIIATVLLILTAPVLILCLIFASGLALLVPVALVGGAFLLLKFNL